MLFYILLVQLHAMVVGQKADSAEPVVDCGEGEYSEICQLRLSIADVKSQIAIKKQEMSDSNIDLSRKAADLKSATDFTLKRIEQYMTVITNYNQMLAHRYKVGNKRRCDEYVKYPIA